ncbi:MAG: hypothetical protein QNJ04_01050 [Desulfobacterales bacterium]|nr:hypothetical protein [Desulfobacterales bacterium]
MNRILIVMLTLALTGIALALPTDMRAEEDTTCQIKATKPVYLEAHYSRGSQKAPSIRRKSGIIWSGNLNRGGVVSITATSGWVHLTFMDLTQDDPRTENDDTICQNNTILVPR